MRTPLVCALLLACAAPAFAQSATLAPFPLPSLDHKSAVSSPGQRVFHVPMRFAKVEAFYRARFGGEKQVAITVERDENSKILTLVSHRGDDTWARAVIREGAVDTVVDVTPVVRFNADVIEGRGLPLVNLILPRSQGVAEQARDIDHTGFDTDPSSSTR